MVGEMATCQPVLPVVGGPHQARIRLVAGGRRGRLAPAECAEARLALLDQGPGQGTRSLEAEVEIRRQGQGRFDPLCSARALVVAIAAPLPASGDASVVEDWLAVERQLHLPVDAAHVAKEDVVRLVVGRSAPVGA